MTLSIIIPIYNVADSLRRCVDSVLAQRISDCELLLVDDGSTDESGRIADEYAAPTYAASTNRTADSPTHATSDCNMPWADT